MKSILVVDDNDKNLRFFEVVLQSSYEVYCVANPQDVLSKAQELLPDLILLDIQMPSMSGTEVMQQLKQDKRVQNIPTFALTALAMPEDETNLLEAGFDGYISKPVTVQVLLMQVAKAFELKEVQTYSACTKDSDTSNLL